ncbi:Bardet-Biedl syndrome 4 [Tribonema minus]|uniref:Bardet-Biedl syndrome 4 n=1 Tax=Tribonema minus TaxID=303371 RepID=A0A835Z7L5_9STRA|nr:Bardet-Biedl syndrome 4 [Tribonema minus]
MPADDTHEEKYDDNNSTGTIDPPQWPGRDRLNWLIYLTFVRRDFKECMSLIEQQLRAHRGLCEYPLYAKGLLLRMEGKIADSLLLFQAAICLNPDSSTYLKQVGRCFYLLGKHKAALGVYDQAEKLCSEDWEVWHNKGLCYTYLRHNDAAAAAYEQANSICRHDATFLQLGRVLQLKGDAAAAVAVYEEALEFSPESSELLTALGLLHLGAGRGAQAFDCLGSALTHDARNVRAILAAGSVMQDNDDMDVALVKYRVAAVHAPNSAQLWNNVGMCFYGKGKLVAAVACLKRAQYLDPFAWKVNFNLGLIHLGTQQYASAFHYFSAAINMNPAHARSYAHLGVALSRLDDFDNACAAYDKALELDGGDATTVLNYAIALCANDEPERARALYERLTRLMEDGAGYAEERDADVIAQMLALQRTLGLGLEAHQ